MKIIVIENNYKENNKKADSTLYPAEQPVIYTLPDTALIKDHKPFFIPDFACPCSFQMHLVVRICRLGRSISKRFASRYYDAVSVGVTFTADNILKEVQENGLPWELAKGFDGAAALGEFIPLDKLDNKEEISFSIKAGDQTIQTGLSKNMLWKVDELISYLSQYYTFKQGDYLYTGCPVQSTEAHPDTHLTGFIGNTKVLSFNVK